MITGGEKLRQLQQELGLNPVEVCAEANVSIATLYNVYAEKRVSPKSLNRVKQALFLLKKKNKVAG